MTVAYTAPDDDIYATIGVARRALQPIRSESHPDRSNVQTIACKIARFGSGGGRDHLWGPITLARSQP